ncbi:PTS sugar transporter subunit IIB [bacterium]|nr:PTS sugar transporter subunit IIB [bacterium]MBU1638642.1 PTS sugar transporter subunit IIB [bacterium]MBU1919587.1 PTS sugar transporter subunit IIB [bacterium]
MKLALSWKKDKLQFPLVRVDDRLLHGQVIVGWGSQLSLTGLVLASDRIKSDVAYASALKSIVPPDLDVTIETLASASANWTAKEYNESRIMIVLESAGDALKLFKSGAPLKKLILGGIHFREGSEEFLPYIFLSRWDKVALSELLNQGIRIVCQDLPATKPTPYTG